MHSRDESSPIFVDVDGGSRGFRSEETALDDSRSSVALHRGERTFAARPGVDGAGDELLARAGFADEEQIVGLRGGALDPAPNHSHPLIRTDC